jgi:hypothetical protein
MKPKPDNGEAVFFELLGTLLEEDERDCLEYEPDRFVLGTDRPGRSAHACTPDIRWRIGLTRRTRLAKLVGVPVELIPETIYLELSSADRYPDATRLPKRAIQKNSKYSVSGRAYVTPTVYFVYKQLRLEDARRVYGVTIVLLRWCEQLKILARPSALDDMIAAELSVRLTAPARL